MSQHDLLHRAWIFMANGLGTARGGARIMPAPVPFLLLLVAACAPCGAPQAARAADAETFAWFMSGSTDWTTKPVEGNNGGFEVQVFKSNGVSPYSPARLSLSWGANGTSYSNPPGQDYSSVGGTFSHDTPGEYTFSFKADYSLLIPRPQADVLMSKTVTLVAVTNITASTNHVAVGTNVLTFTAQMTPVAAGEHLYWNLPNGGGTLSTNQGLTTSLVCDTPGEFLVMAICGSSFVTTTIKVYAVTSVTLSTNVAKLGETVTATATVEPGGNPLPLIWSGGGATPGDTGTTLTITNAPLGESQVRVSLGNSGATNSLTVVNVQILQRTNYACAGSAVTAAFSQTNSFGPVIWTLTPTNGPFPPTLSDPSAAAVEVTPGRLAGTFTLTCKSTLRPDVSDTATLRVFAIRPPLLVQHPDGGPFVDPAPDTLNVLFNQTATFKATNALARPFPFDVPVWSYWDPIVGPNDTKTVSFFSYSASDDRFPLTAATGLPIASHSILVGRYVLGVHAGYPSNSLSPNPTNTLPDLNTGHAWITVADWLISFQDTYGLWPDSHPDYTNWNNGPLSDVRKNHPGEGGSVVSRYYFLKPSEYGRLMDYVNTHATWGYFKNCSSWAAGAAQAAVGEPLSAGVVLPTPATLGSDITSREALGAVPTDLAHPFGASFRRNLLIIQGF